MPPTGQAIRRAVTTCGGIRPDTTAPTAGIIGMIPGIIAAGVMASTILGIMDLTAGMVAGGMIPGTTITMAILTIAMAIATGVVESEDVSAITTTLAQSAWIVAT